MFQNLLQPLLRKLPPEARPAIACYTAAGLFLVVVVFSNINVYLQCVLVIYTQIIMVFTALRGYDVAARK